MNFRNSPVRGGGRVAGFLVAAVAGLSLSASVLGADPFAFNNTVYPTAEDVAKTPGWDGTLRPSNYAYPTAPVAPTFVPGGGLDVASGGLDQRTAPLYAQAVKLWLTRNNISGLVNEPLTWNPIQAGWYDMPWGAEGSPQANGEISPESGREAILGSYAGQVIRSSTFGSIEPGGPAFFQNHSVVYYNAVAGAMLGQVWANPYEPNASAVCPPNDPSRVCFPEGSIIVKVEGAALDPKYWPPLEGSTISYVYRPTAEEFMDPNNAGKLEAGMVPMYFAQMAVKVRDSVASPETGWVFIGFTYDKSIPGSTWDRTVPVGATWGNDPECTSEFSGKCANGAPLTQTWVNPNAPGFADDSLGWGNRLAAPMDVARRHNVLTVGGKRYSGVGNEVFPASSCMSCHGSAQYPFVANLYPSPNLVFPEDGSPFLFFDPGSPQWANWFQNRAGDVPMSGSGHTGIVSMDYDMMLTLALMTALGGAGTDAFINNPEFGH